MFPEFLCKWRPTSERELPQRHHHKLCGQTSNAISKCALVWIHCAAQTCKQQPELQTNTKISEYIYIYIFVCQRRVCRVSLSHCEQTNHTHFQLAICATRWISERYGGTQQALVNNIRKSMEMEFKTIWSDSKRMIVREHCLHNHLAPRCDETRGSRFSLQSGAERANRWSFLISETNRRHINSHQQRSDTISYIVLLFSICLDIAHRRIPGSMGIFVLFDFSLRTLHTASVIFFLSIQY